MTQTPLNHLKGTLVLGVDPGLKGAFSLIRRLNPHQIEAVHDFPVEVKNGKNRINPYLLAATIESYASQIAYAMVEEVGVMSGREGTVSMFNFGYGAGIVAGILAASVIPVLFVRPAVWKAALGLTRDKEDSRALASRIFPAHVAEWKRKKDDGRAEASLLAWFGATRLK